MADASLRYAEALLAAAQQENALAIVTKEMRALAHAFAPVAATFRAPVFPACEQVSVVNEALGNDTHPLTKRFFVLLAERRRLGLLPRIAALFDRMACKALGEVHLYLTVYAATRPEMIPKIIEALGRKGLFDPVHKENVKLHIEVDSRLLGGFIAECDGITWDGSLRSRLVDLSKVIRKL